MTWNNYKGPRWQQRLLQLREQGYSFEEILLIFKDEGFVSVHGKKLTVFHLKSRLTNMRRGRVKS